MIVVEHSRKAGASLKDIEEAIEGRVFHVTRRENWPAIQQSGAILPNLDGHFSSTFGYATNSFFPRRGCVSVFDYREPPDKRIRESRGKCHPFGPAWRGQGAALLILDRSIEQHLLPWTLWVSEGKPSEMIVPYVEAGHRGAIPLCKVEQIILLCIEEDPSTPAAILRRARLAG